MYLRIHLLVESGWYTTYYNLFAGMFDYNQDLPMAKIILLHKDKDSSILDHNRQIALLNIG